jgi:hypothetical protein
MTSLERLPGDSDAMARGIGEFAQLLRGDAEVRKQVEDLSAELKGRARDEAIVQLAARIGYAFTVAELEKAIDDGLARLLADPEIADEELEDVVDEKTGCFVGWIGRAIFGPTRASDPTTEA